MTASTRSTAVSGPGAASPIIAAQAGPLVGRPTRIRWVAVTATAEAAEGMAQPSQQRRRKQTRCRSCEYSHPHSDHIGGVRLCAEPSRDPLLVLGDQMPCTLFIPRTMTVA